MNPKPPNLLRAATLGALLLLAFMLGVTAYLCDDAYITFRSIDNFIHGLGLTFNPAERVLAFTNPLWAFVHIPAALLTGEYYYTTMALSFVATCATVYMASRFLGPSGFLVFLLTLITSKAFIDFSSSGLENPLSHLLACAVVIMGYRDDLERKRVVQWSALLCALLVTNRMDMVLIAAPFLVALCWESDAARSARNVGTAFLWGSPALLWLLFCLFYYGAAFPNTAYAKIWDTGIPASEYLERGIGYYSLTLGLDPFSLLAIAVGIVVALGRRELRAAALALGVSAYLVYLVFHGSDQMAPRYFSTPLVVAALMIGRFIDGGRGESAGRSRVALASALSVIALANLALPYVPIKCLSPDYKVTDHATQVYRGMKDHRAIWSFHRITNHDFRQKKFPVTPVSEPEIRVSGAIGIQSYQRGPNSHTLDFFGLADPLLSRLPSGFPGWIPGHIRRNLPAGYVESIYYDENRIQDPNLHIYYDAIREITRGDLWSTKRLKTILDFNLGRYDEYLERYDPKGGINVYKLEHYQDIEVAHLGQYSPKFKALINYTVTPKSDP